MDFWDRFCRNNNLMTNEEFFSSNEEGGFYEGYYWDSELGDWVEEEE